MENSGRTLVCSVVFLDIAEYSKKPVAEQLQLKQSFNGILASALEQVPLRDRILLDTGDGAAIAFIGDPEDALFSAMSIRDSAGALPVRLGVNLGPVRLLKDLNGQMNIIGDGINVAQRVMGFARPGQLLVADFTYVPLAGGGFAYTAFCFDAFAGTILGWECSLSKETAFVQRAIGQAAAALRRAAGGPITWRPVHHSDAGSQYTSLKFTETLALAAIAPSIGTVGDAYDNALAETLIGLYKSEAVRDGSPFRDGPVRALSDLEKITAAWVAWYNSDRLVRRLGLRPPAEADAEHRASQQA